MGLKFVVVVQNIKKRKDFCCSVVQWSAIVIITATGTRHASMSHVATRTGGKWTRQQNKKEK
ncbi:Uncharacterized protein APZ42_002439 [Daphnia magna]|uniref:Uncharacterized protein n=1 Tax=Daphnia magna TaxID=35525 RepID=A0A164I9C5_9CRUS|nr:Uncharacterized protein APZ42_002439 [Daphnia magna]